MTLKNFDFVDELSQEGRDLVEKNLKAISLDKGVTLFYQGDITKDILLLESGEVRVYIQGDGINEITLYTLNNHDQCIVNTTSTISQIPTIGSAITMTPITGYMLSREIVTTLMQTNSSYQEYMFSLLTMRLDSVARVLESVKFKQLDERIYEWIQEQGTFEIIKTHEEIANILGSSRVVVSRLLKKLEREGFIELARGKIILKP